MSKAVLELDFMPTRCIECVLSTNKNDNWLCTAFNVIKVINIGSQERPTFCPLKEQEG